MSLTPEIERVQEWDDFLAAHELPAQTGRNLGKYRVEWICSCLGEQLIEHLGRAAA